MEDRKVKFMALSRQNKTVSGTKEFPVRLGAIDAGSNAIRFLAAEFRNPQEYTILESIRAGVRLGHDVFLSGKLTRPAMDAAVAVLGQFREKLEQLGISRWRAVTTSAVRESANGESFIRRVTSETGLRLEIITGLEEARLVHLAVRSKIPLGKQQWILADLGGGSLEVSLADENGIFWSESHTMGSVRLMEELAGTAGDPGRFQRLLAEYVSTLRLPSALKNQQLAGFIATGGSIEALARLAAGSATEAVFSLNRDKLRGMIETLSRMPYRERVEILQMREDQADVVIPAALVYERLLTLSGAEQVLVPKVGIKEGILLDLLDELTAARQHEDRHEQQIREGSISLGRRYFFDEAHGVQVCRLALQLFDQLQRVHRLGRKDRRILMTAAILHDIGSYVSFKKHHKHSQYLISQSEITGLSPAQAQLAALVARYHRKSDPDPRHPEFAGLVLSTRLRAMKLSALLRLADSLDREHQQNVQNLRTVVKERQVIISAETPGELLLERWALQKKAQLFEKVFRMSVKLQS